MLGGSIAALGGVLKRAAGGTWPRERVLQMFFCYPQTADGSGSMEGVDAWAYVPIGKKEQKEQKEKKEKQQEKEYEAGCRVALLACPPRTLQQANTQSALG